MSEPIKQDRRGFLRRAVMALAGAELATLGSVRGQSSKKASLIEPGTNTSFDSLYQIDAGLLNVGYA